MRFSARSFSLVRNASFREASAFESARSRRAVPLIGHIRSWRPLSIIEVCEGSDIRTATCGDSLEKTLGRQAADGKPCLFFIGTFPSVPKSTEIRCGSRFCRKRTANRPNMELVFALAWRNTGTKTRYQFVQQTVPRSAFPVGRRVALLDRAGKQCLRQ